MTLWSVTTSSASALRTSSGRPIRAAVVRAIERQVKADDRTLRLVEGLRDDVARVEKKQSSSPRITVAPPKQEDTDQ